MASNTCETDFDRKIHSVALVARDAKFWLGRAILDAFSRRTRTAVRRRANIGSIGPNCTARGCDGIGLSTLAANCTIRRRVDKPRQTAWICMAARFSRANWRELRQSKRHHRWIFKAARSRSIHVRRQARCIQIVTCKFQQETAKIKSSKTELRK